MNVNNTIDQLAPSGLAYWLFLFFSYYKALPIAIQENL